MTITEDIKPSWLNVIRRLQSVCARNHGAMIIAINIVVDENGNPVCWTEPNTRLIEPSRKTNEILELLTQ